MSRLYLLRCCSVVVVALSLLEWSLVSASTCTSKALTLVETLSCAHDSTVVRHQTRHCDFDSKYITVESTPADQSGAAQGSLFEVSHNYGKYGIDPKVDSLSLALNAGSQVAEAKHRLVWRAPQQVRVFYLPVERGIERRVYRGKRGWLNGFEVPGDRDATRHIE